VPRAGGAYGRERAAERITAALHQGRDLVSFWNEARSALQKAVPYHLTPCWFTIDPASLLVTSHYDHGMIPELPHAWLAHEYLEDDFNSLADIARSPKGASTLHEATSGDPSRSERWNRFIRPYGGEEELLVALRTRPGETWGVLALYREAGHPPFDKEEIDFLERLSPYLAAGAQRALLIGEAMEPEGPDSPALLILNEACEIESATSGSERLLAELDAEIGRDELPTPILSVAGQALHSARIGDIPGDVAFARVLSRAGRWLVVHGAAFTGGRPGRVAVIIEPAHPARIAPLLMSAYRLTEREQEITRLVLRAASTNEIAGELSVAPQTVQQHFKSIFEKTGVRSRRDLVGKVFFSHYEPRLRDNERRAIDGRPLRGGPAPPGRVSN
jgi:DNA-binding CsgD family transcriptional regulator/GAF domain-containing protein